MTNIKKLLALLLAVVMVVAMFVGCDNDTNPTGTTEGKSTPSGTAGTDGNTTTTAGAPETTEEPVPEEDWDGAYIDRDDFRAYTAYDLETTFKGMEAQLDGDVLAAVTAAYETGARHIPTPAHFFPPSPSRIPALSAPASVLPTYRARRTTMSTVICLSCAS